VLVFLQLLVGACEKCNAVTMTDVFDVAQVFFKENVGYPEWICRDPISLILGTRIGSLKRLKKN